MGFVNYIGSAAKMHARSYLDNLERAIGQVTER